MSDPLDLNQTTVDPNAPQPNLPMSPLPAPTMPVSVGLTSDEQATLDAIRFNQLDKMMLADRPLPTDEAELERLAQFEGIDVSAPIILKQFEDREKAIDEQYNERDKNKRMRPESYIKARNRAMAWNDLAAIAFSFLFVTVFTPLGLIALFVSEFVAVAGGIMTFWKEGWLLVAFLSFTIVSVYFALEWLTVGIQHRHKSKPKYHFTLADLRKRWNYFWSDDPNLERMVKEDRSEMNALTRTRRIVIIVIIILGLLGRMGTQLQALEGNWREAFVALFIDSSLYELLEYVGAPLITFALLVATHWLMGFMYTRYIAAVGTEQVDFLEESSQDRSAAKQQARVQLLQQKLIVAWQKRESKTRSQAVQYNQLRAKKTASIKTT